MTDAAPGDDTLAEAALPVEENARQTERAEQAEELARVLAAVGAAPDVHAALDALIQGAARLVPSSTGSARTFDPDTGERDYQVLVNAGGAVEHHVAPGRLPPQSFGDLLRLGSGPIVVHDYAADDPAVPADYPFAAGIREGGARAAVHMPIESGGRVIGNLSLNHPEPGRFGPREVAVLGALTSLAGAAIGRARLDARQRQVETEHARMEGAMLVARTTAHEINNALNAVVGYSELLSLRPAVAADPVLSRYAGLILQGALDAATRVAQLQSLVRLAENTTLMAEGHAVLDLHASTADVSNADATTPD